MSILKSGLIRSPLKYAGGKAGHIHKLKHDLREGEGTLIDLFAGGGTLFLNVDFPRYVINDINPDLNNFYVNVKTDVDEVITIARGLFAHNDEKSYYSLRDEFNHTGESIYKAALLLYLNRHGYNGLMRYSGMGERRKFNVPFGRYSQPYLPVSELLTLSERSQKAEFTCADFRDVLQQKVNAGDTVLADPPYSPKNSKGFTTYAGNQFTDKEHADLTEILYNLKLQGVRSVIFNHDIRATRDLYKLADFRRKIKIKRPINRNVEGRAGVQEVMAFYGF